MLHQSYTAQVIQAGKLSATKYMLQNLNTSMLTIAPAIFMNILTGNFPPVIVGPSTFRVNIGEEVFYNFMVEDGEVQVLGGLPPNSALEQYGGSISMYSFRWTMQEPVDMSLIFIANNSMNAISLLIPHVEVCACSNGGTCTLDGILGIQNNRVVLACECPEGNIIMCVVKMWE